MGWCIGWCSGNDSIVIIVMMDQFYCLTLTFPFPTYLTCDKYCWWTSSTTTIIRSISCGRCSCATSTTVFTTTTTASSSPSLCHFAGFDGSMRMSGIRFVQHHEGTDYGCRLSRLIWSCKFDAQSTLFSIAHDQWDFCNTVKFSLSRSEFLAKSKRAQWSWANEKRVDWASNLQDQIKRYFCVPFELTLRVRVRDP